MPAHRASGATVLRLAPMRRLILPGLVVVAAAALLALLAFGVSKEGSNKSIDAALAKGARPAAPSAHTSLPVLG